VYLSEPKAMLFNHLDGTKINHDVSPWLPPWLKV